MRRSYILRLPYPAEEKERRTRGGEFCGFGNGPSSSRVRWAWPSAQFGKRSGKTVDLGTIGARSEKSQNSCQRRTNRIQTRGRVVPTILPSPPLPAQTCLLQDLELTARPASLHNSVSTITAILAIAQDDAYTETTNFYLSNGPVEPP